MDKFRLTECQTLDIPVGNDVPLLVKLVKGFDGCDGEGVVPFPIDVCENVAVTMVSERGQVKSVAHRLGTDGEVLLELQAGDFRAGLTYGIDVRATLNDKAVHAYGKSLVRITAATERGPRQVAQAADPYEVTLYVGYVGDLIPRRLDELEGYDDLMDEVGGKADAEEVGREFQKYIPLAQKAVAGGVASLNGDGKVPTSQIPDLPYIPSNKKGAAGGVAELNGDGKVPTAQAQFAMRGNLVAADIDSTALQSGFYRIIGQRLGADILGGDEANGVLIQYSDGYKEQVLMVGRTAGAAAGEQVETYTRRRLNAAGRWTAWSQNAGKDTLIVRGRYQNKKIFLDHTHAELKQAYIEGRFIIIIYDLYIFTCTECNIHSGYKFKFTSFNYFYVLLMSVSSSTDNQGEIIQKKNIDKLDQSFWNEGTWETDSLISPKKLLAAVKNHTSNKANNEDVYTKEEADERFQPKGNYLTEHQDISGKQDVQQTAVYTADSTAEDFHPMELGSLQEGENSWTLYKFFFKVGNLPNNTSLVVSLAQLLANYTIGHIVSVHGVASSGHFVSSGRTDNLSQVCVAQQGSRQRKEITLRTYADLSSDSATLLIEFYGTKDA